jgi:hypothetical protein
MYKFKVYLIYRVIILSIILIIFYGYDNIIIFYTLLKYKLAYLSIIRTININILFFILKIQIILNLYLHIYILSNAKPTNLNKSYLDVSKLQTICLSCIQINLPIC